MAKITQKATQTGFTRNYGKVIMYQPHRTIPVAKKYTPGRITTYELQNYSGLVKRYIETTWQQLTEQQRQEYENTAKKFFITGFELFKTEIYKQMFGTKYNMAIYGITTYGYG